MTRFILPFKSWLTVFALIAVLGLVQWGGWWWLLDSRTVSEGVATNIQLVIYASEIGLELGIDGKKTVTTSTDVVFSYLKNPGPISFEVRGSGRIVPQPRESEEDPSS